MTRAPFYLSAELARYVAEHTDPPEPELAAVISATSGLAEGDMQVAAEQARLLGMLVDLTGAEHVLEIGTFTGLSSLAMALRLPPHGRLVACDLDEAWTAIAREHWEAAGVADRIELRLGPAMATLAALVAEGTAPFDLVFIDADKEGYPGYLDAVAPLVRRGALVLADNTLRAGRVVDAEAGDDATEAIRRFNAMAVADERFETLLLPVFDGLTMLHRR